VITNPTKSIDPESVTALAAGIAAKAQLEE
jgi:hypothetical protein